ncbi:N-acetylmuramoyl-L-alanine amidase [Lysinibacillus fusiformis]|uniref:N-acetylmuramoyl-L-alanine amidase n=1 Tax=Lysinibacillus fusiformis TaxID=28031 RepID=UPI0019678F63|nr:N-acetylmuramoyl-L-alanine amidase [Lysinibacillus fusiformis]QSB10426.1 N-acetylmuramoyl-L-alanine amidase [Lysinibacillus fusiformis]
MTRPQKIEFHVGHYGDGTGANSLIDEVQYARKFIKRIYDICIANGVPATYYEDKISKNQIQNINNLIAHHNADRNGFIVSGHLNASGSVTDQAIGAEVLYYDQVAIAKEIVDAICSVSGLKNRGAKKRTDLGVLVRTYEPAILIEFGFVNSKKDIELMDQHFEPICQAVATVLAAHIGYTIKKEGVPVAQTTEAKVIFNDCKTIPAIIKDNRTYVQVREIAGLLGLKLVYNNESKTTKLYEVK